MRVVVVLALLSACRGVSGDAAVREAREAYGCSLTQVAASGPLEAIEHVRGLDIDATGRVYVANWPGPQIVVLSPTARPVQTIGRDGEGPGEFKFLSSIDVFGGDSVLVLDQTLERLSVFPPDSSSVRYTLRTPRVAMMVPAWASKTSQGTILVGYREIISAHDAPRSRARPKEVLFLLDPSGTVTRDSVLVVAGPEPLVARMNGMIRVAAENPFGQRSFVVLGRGDSVFYASTDTLGVRIFSLAGEPRGGFSVHHRADPVTRQDINTYLESRPPDWADAFRRALRETKPRQWPSIEDLLVEDGRVWLAGFSRDGQPTRWTAFAPSGSPLCSVEVPHHVDLKLIRGGRAYGVATDEDEVQQIVIYRLETHDPTERQKKA